MSCRLKMWILCWYIVLQPYTIRVLAIFEIPARTTNTTWVNFFHQRLVFPLMCLAKSRSLLMRWKRMHVTEMNRLYLCLTLLVRYGGGGGGCQDQITKLLDVVLNPLIYHLQTLRLFVCKIKSSGGCSQVWGTERTHVVELRNHT